MNHKDIRRDLRAMVRSISNQQIEPHHNVRGIAAMLFAGQERRPSKGNRARILQSSVAKVRMKGNAMNWTTPILVEICIGLEINGYLPAEF